MTEHHGNYGKSFAPRAKFQPTASEIAWAAGFFQGEGHVSAHGRSVTAAQTEREPLDKLALYFGGKVSSYSRLTVSGKPVWGWSACGNNMREFATAIMPLMTGLKLAQLKERIRWT